jgi:orotate phosphoribosyltransferase
VTPPKSTDKAELGRRINDVCRLTGRFTLRSGQIADFYFDKYLFESDPGLLAAVAGLAEPLIPDGTELMAGLELGGVPVATALSLRTSIPQLLVRKEAKTYGTAKLAEGPDFAGRRILVVEDVTTTGGQVALSTRDLRERGAVVDTVLCVIDRSGGHHRPLDEAGLAIRSVFDLTFLDSVARPG